MSLNMTQNGDTSAFNVWNKPNTWTEANSPCSPIGDIWSTSAMTNSKSGSLAGDSSATGHLKYNTATTAATSQSVIGSIGKMNGISAKMSGLSLAPGTVSSAQVSQNGWLGQASSEENRPASLGPSVWSVPSATFGDSAWNETSNSEVTSPWSKPESATDSWNGGSAFWSSEANKTSATSDSGKEGWFGGDTKRQSPSGEDRSTVSSVNAVSRGDTPTNTPKPSDTPCSIDVPKSANDELIEQLINTTDNWGKAPVDQTTSWNVENVVPSKLDRNRQYQSESNVWLNEPPTGTGIWEAYYESLGKKPAHWQQSSAPNSSTWDGTPDNAWSETDSMWNKSRPPSGWMPDSGEPKLSRASSVAGSRSVWGASSSVDDGNWASGSEAGNEWCGGSRAGSDANNWNVGSRGGNTWNGEACKDDGPGGHNMWRQPPPNHPAASSMYWMDGQGQQQQGMPPNGRRIGNGNRINQMRVHAIKQLVDLGFKKEDAQSALIKHNMDIDRAITELKERAMMFGVGGGMGSGDLAMSPLDDCGLPGAPRGIRGCGPNGPGGGMMGGPPQPPSQGPQQTPSQAIAGQQMMRQQIMSQLRTAVHKKMIHPSQLNAQTSSRDLQVFQQIITCQQEEVTLKQRLQLVAEQLQNGAGSSNPLLTQQYEAGVNRLRSLSHQLAAFYNKLSSQAKMQQQQRTMQGPPPPGPPPMGSRGGGQQNMPPLGSGGEFNSGGRPGGGPPSINRMESWQVSGSQSDMDGVKQGLNYGRSMSMQPPGGGADFPGLDLSTGGGGGWESAFFPGGNTNNNSLSSGIGGVGPQQQQMMNQGGGGGASPGSMGGPGPAVAVDVAEFVPGRPWQGASTVNMDDPTVTPASAKSLFNNVNNDRLEKLAAVAEGGMGRKQQWNGNSNQSLGGGGGGGSQQQQPNIGGRNWGGDKSAFSAYSPVGLAGGLPPTNNQSAGSVALMIRNLNAVSADFARNTCQSLAAINFVPNPQAGWAVALFTNRDDALRVLRYLSTNGLQVEPISDQETLMALKMAQHAQQQ